MRRTKLSNLKPGSFFKFGNTIGFKTEYYTIQGAVEAYCVGSGEFFWGGTSSPEQQSSLMVTKIEMVEKNG